MGYVYLSDTSYMFHIQLCILTRDYDFRLLIISYLAYLSFNFVFGDEIASLALFDVVVLLSQKGQNNFDVHLIRCLTE